MNIYSASSLFASIACSLLAFLVYSKNKKEAVNCSFAVITFLASIWTLFPFLTAVAENNSRAILYARAIYFAAVFVPPTFLSFVLHLIGEEKTRNEERVLKGSYFLGAVFFVINFFPLIIKGVHRFSPNFYVIPGLAYHFFVLFFGFICLYAFIKLLFGYEHAGHYKREQYKYVFIAYIFAYVGGLMHFLPSYFGSVAEPLPHDLLLICFASIIAYAILRYRLLDIEVVIKRGLAYSLVTALLTGIFVSLILVSDRVFRGVTGYNSLWAGITGAFVIALVFQPLRDAIQKTVDRVFFRTRYDYQRILRKYSHALAQPMADLNRFARLAPYLLTKTLHLSGASVMVLDREKHNYRVRAGERNAADLVGIELKENSPLISEIMFRRKELALEEIKYWLKSESELSPEVRKKLQAIADEMEHLNAVLIIPSISESEYFKEPTLLSTLNLGKKMSDQNFSQEDIEFLKTLANQASISVEYAFIFEELKKNQAAVVQSEKMAAIGTTTAGVAHELKNPLTYLSTLSQILSKKWDDPEFRSSVSHILPSEIQRMQMIVEGLLDYSRNKELVLKPVEVKEVIDKTQALLAYEIRKNKVEVKTDYKHEGMAKGDPNRLMQVFMNIVANAVQAMGRSGGELIISTENHNNDVRILIKDTGPGMPKETLKRIFDPFYSTKDGGTGLGLAITKKIVEEHKGSIQVESIQGQGTIFTIQLPRT